jgi:hypothetical protein
MMATTMPEILERSAHARASTHAVIAAMAEAHASFREVPVRMIIIGDGAPMHRRQVIQTCGVNGATRGHGFNTNHACAKAWFKGPNGQC